MPEATAEFLINLAFDKTAAEQARIELRSMGDDALKAAKDIDPSWRKVGESISSATKLTQEGATTITKLTQTIENATGQQKNLVTSVKQTEDGIRRLDEGTRVVDTTMKSHDKTIGGLFGSYLQLGLRAIAIVPIWNLIRGANAILFGSIEGLIKEFISLEAGIQKVITAGDALERNQAEVSAQLDQAARGAFKTSTASFKEITEAMFELGNAGRSTEEVLAGFDKVLNLAKGTFGDVRTAAKLVGSTLNVFGDELESVGTTEEQIEFITDNLAAAFKNNQVSLGDLESSLSFLSASGAALDISFKELVGATSILNNNMLRGGKGGRNLASALAEISKNSDKLRELGVIFDANKALNFKDIITQLAVIFDQMPASFNKMATLTEVFGTEGARAISPLINDIQKFNTEVERGGEEIKGLAEQLRKVSEQTFFKQLQIAFRSFFTSADIGTGEKNFLTRGLIEFNEISSESTNKINKLRDVFLNLGSDVQITVEQVAAVVSELNSLRAPRIAEDIFKQAEEAGIQREDIEKLLLPEPNLGRGGSDIFFEPFKKLTQEQINLAENREKIVTALFDKGASQREQRTKKEVETQTGILSAFATARFELLQKGVQTEELRSLGIRESILLEKELNDAISTQNSLLVRQAELNNKQIPSLLTIQDVLNGNVDALIRSGRSEADIQKLLEQGAKIQVAKIKEERTSDDIRKSIIASQVQILQSQGATALQAVKTRLELEKRLDVEKTALDVLNDQLELQRAITEESKKTKEERLKDLENAINNKIKEKRNQSAFANFGQGFQESNLRSRAGFAGVSSKEIDDILEPTKGLNRIDAFTPSVDRLINSTDNLDFRMFDLTSAVERLTTETIKRQNSTTGLVKPTTSAFSAQSGIVAPTVGTTQTPSGKFIEVKTGDVSLLINTKMDPNEIKKTIDEQLNGVNEKVKKQVFEQIETQLNLPGTKIFNANKRSQELN